MTECTQTKLECKGLGRRRVEAQFTGERISSDGGGLLLGEADARIGLLAGLAGCFQDYRNPLLIDYSVEKLLRQRVHGLALGYEDLNDHEQLRHDPRLSLLVPAQNR